MKRIALLIAINLCSIVALAQAPADGQSVTYRPTLVVSNECAQVQDKFLCMALRKGSELLEQQINCEVIQSYTQKAWDGRLLTKKPDNYYVRVQKSKEVFYKIDKAGNLAHPAERPEYQAIRIYSSASWYTNQAAIFNNGRFFNKRTAGDRTIYSYAVDRVFTLVSGHSSTTVDVEGEIEFDKAGLLRRIYLKYKMLPNEMKRHLFNHDEEETIFDNPKGFEEAQPVPVKFWAKAATTYGDKVIIEAAYSNYKRFETDVVFSETVEEVKPNVRRRIDGRLITIKEN